MFQNQMPAWVSHSLSDPCQVEDGRYLASCALKVRVWWWWRGRFCQRQMAREACPGDEESVRSQRGWWARNTCRAWLRILCLAPGRDAVAQSGPGLLARDGTTEYTHKLCQPACGDLGPSRASQASIRDRQCLVLQGRIHMWPVLVVTGH